MTSLTENFIQIRFASEQQFERFVLKGQSISYNEVMQKLNQKKRISINTEKDRILRADKIDRIQLLNLDKESEEITEKSGMIEANTKILVKRMPMKENEAINVSYNQMNNSLTKLKDKRRLGIACELGDPSDEEENEQEEKEPEPDANENVESEDDDQIQFTTYTLDVSKIDKEFQCPLPKNFKQYHILQNPVVTTCCGHSACLKCLVQKIMIEQSGINRSCCFCGSKIDMQPDAREGVAKVIPNTTLRSLLRSQVDFDQSKMQYDEGEDKEAVKKQIERLLEGKREDLMSREQAEAEERKLNAQTDADREEAEAREKEKERNHFANKRVNENTRFLIVGLPNIKVLKLAQIKEVLPVTKSTCDKIQALFSESQSNIIVFITIKDSLTFHAAFELSFEANFSKETEVTFEFGQLHLGSFFSQLHALNLSQSEIQFQKNLILHQHIIQGISKIQQKRYHLKQLNNQSSEKDFELDFENALEILSLKQKQQFDKFQDQAVEISMEFGMKISKLFGSGQPEVDQELIEELKEMNEPTQVPSLLPVNHSAPKEPEAASKKRTDQQLLFSNDLIKMVDPSFVPELESPRSNAAQTRQPDPAQQLQANQLIAIQLKFITDAAQQGHAVALQFTQILITTQNALKQLAQERLKTENLCRQKILLAKQTFPGQIPFQEQNEIMVLQQQIQQNGLQIVGQQNQLQQISNRIPVIYQNIQVAMPQSISPNFVRPVTSEVPKEISQANSSAHLKVQDVKPSLRSRSGSYNRPSRSTIRRQESPPRSRNDKSPRRHSKEKSRKEREHRRSRSPRGSRRDHRDRDARDGGRGREQRDRDQRKRNDRNRSPLSNNSRSGTPSAQGKKSKRRY